jgi:hypothetical protein
VYILRILDTGRIVERQKADTERGKGDPAEYTSNEVARISRCPVRIEGSFLECLSALERRKSSRRDGMFLIGAIYCYSLISPWLASRESRAREKQILVRRDVALSS